MSIPFLRNSYDTQDDVSVQAVVLAYTVSYPTESRAVTLGNADNRFAGFGVNNANVPTISFHEMTLKDTGTPSLDWTNRRLWDQTGEIITLRWDVGRLEYGNVSVDWINRLLYKNDGTTVMLDWQNGTFNGTANNVSGTVGAANGGTGLTSYAVGDLLYASASATLSKLAAVATGNALISGGVTTAPSWGKIGLTTHVSGTLGPTNGGTGTATVATGDLLYGSATNTWSKLAGVATGNALISGGVTTAPAWGKIGLTTHVTGTLGVGNGGTGATSFTAGQILFGNGASALNATSKLTWDNTGFNLTALGQLIVTGSSAPNNGLCVFSDLVNGVCYVTLRTNTAFGLFGVTEATGHGFFQTSTGMEVQVGGGGLGPLACSYLGLGVFNDGSGSATLRIQNLGTYIMQLDGGDDASTPSNTSTPVGWQHVFIDGAEAWIPYYR